MKFNRLNEISQKKKNNNHFNTLYGSNQNILNEIKNSDYNIRIIETPNPIINFQNEIGYKTCYKQNKEEEEDKLNLGENKKSDISSEEFFMRKSQVNYIKKNLSPVRANTLRINDNFVNNNSNNSSIKRIFSARNNNYANLIKSDLILIWNIIQHNANIINFYKHQFQNEIEISSKNKVKLNKSDLITCNNTIVSKLNLKNILIQKRCLEIDNEIKENFSEIIDKINENSKNTELLMNNYKCLVKEELIFKMALENNLNQFLIKKIDDLFFLMNLKNLNENNEFINDYSETHSKIKNISHYIELMKKLILNKVMNPPSQDHSSKSGFNGQLKSNKFTRNKFTYNNLGNKDNDRNYCAFNCEYCMKITNEENEDYEKNGIKIVFLNKQ